MSDWTLYRIVVTTVYSGVEYFVKNHDVFRKAA